MAASSAPGSAIIPTNISTTTPPNPPGNACPPWRADIPIGALAPLFVSRLPRRPALSYPKIVIPSGAGRRIFLPFAPAKGRPAQRGISPLFSLFSVSSVQLRYYQ